jgi:hypothetical protein
VLRILPSVARGGVEKHTYLYHIPPADVKKESADFSGFASFFQQEDGSAAGREKNKILWLTDADDATIIPPVL